MAVAEVNMQTASFIQKQNDFHTSVMARTYNSRSLWFGIFGFGWCSEFERQLDPIHQRLTHCDLEVAAAIQAKNDRWVVTELNTETKFKKQTYNFRGQLMQIMDSSGKSWSLNYDSQGRLSRIHSQRTSFEFIYQGQHLQKIEASKDPPATYKWNGNLLIETKSFIGITRYRYNDLMNLTDIEEGHRQRTQINYDDEQDRVRQVKIGACQQDFRFQKRNNKSFQSIATTRCPSQAIQTQTFNFTLTAKKGKHETLSYSNVDP
jgi:YD repeat-containing protein